MNAKTVTNFSAILAASTMITACCMTKPGPSPEPGPPNPPAIVDQTPTSPAPRIGDQAEVVFVAEGGVEPIEWIEAILPSGWTASVSADTRTWTAAGVVPVGGADRGLTFRATARDANGVDSDAKERQLRARSRTFDAQLQFHNDAGILKQYRVRVPQLPPWPPDSGGRVVLWVDTEGLAPAGPDDDWIKVWSAEPAAFEVFSEIKSDGLTRAGIRELGETITLSTEAHRQGLADREFAVSIRCFHGSEIHVRKVEVTVY